MKRILFSIAIFGALAAAFSACDTEIEAFDMQPSYKYTDKYYENLRAYKAGMKERSICFVWFADYSTNTTLAYRFEGLPDSVDIVSLWGGIPEPERNPVAYREMYEMREKKGFKYVIPTIIRIMENENYANFGLTRDDMINQKTSIDPYGIYPDWCILYGDHLLNQMWEHDLDGLDLDYEPESSDEQNYGIYGARLTLFVQYLGQFIGPSSPNPDKLLILDFASRTPAADTNPYVDYFVKQQYGSTISNSNFGTYPNEKRIFTENIGDYWATGGQMLQQAAFQPSTGYKGGFGAFYCQRDYNTTDSGANKDTPYGHLRRAIQLQNPARTE